MLALTAAAAGAALALTAAPPAHAQYSPGPDVAYSNVTAASTYGPVADVRAYIYDTETCNLGDTDLAWVSNGTPGVGFNLYRVHGGRIVQLGQSWTKVACCAAATAGCGLACNGMDGTLLGSGCRDMYSSSWNAIQSRLAPRSQVNPWTGTFGAVPPFAGSAVDRRLQVAESDLLLSSFPGAVYIAEGVYVAAGESQATRRNNASHRVASINQSTFQMTFFGMPPVQPGIPAVQAWRDHGLGDGVPDPAVNIQQVDVPSEGRFWVAHKVSDNGDGTHRYEYAVFNLNSHVSGGSFAIPVPDGVTVTNIGFRDVNYHSGEVYDNTDWVVETTAGTLRWRSPQDFAQNPNSNALRWGTMYNFWFTADQPPVDGDATLGLFRPHTPSSVSFTVGVPTGGGCSTDWNSDQAVNSADISAYLTAWIDSINQGNLAADFNGDLAVNSADVSAFLTAWIDELTNGC